MNKVFAAIFIVGMLCAAQKGCDCAHNDDNAYCQRIEDGDLGSGN